MYGVRQKLGGDSDQIQWSCMFCTWERWKEELVLLKKKLWLAVTIILAEYVHLIFKNIAYMRHDALGPLRDLGFDLIPQMNEELDWIGEMLAAMFIILSVCVFLLPCLIKNNKYNFFIIGGRWALVTAITTMLRCATFLATSVPGPHSHCLSSALTYDPPTKWEQIYESSRLNFVAGCGDLIFSGHTLLLLAFFLTIKDNLKKMLLFDDTHQNQSYQSMTSLNDRYNKRDANKKLLYRYKRAYYFVVYGIFFPLLSIILILIIAARKHYTIDVLLAIYVTPLVHHASYSIMSDDFDKPVPLCCYTKNEYFIKDETPRNEQLNNQKKETTINGNDLSNNVSNNNTNSIDMANNSIPSILRHVSSDSEIGDNPYSNDAVSLVLRK